MPSSPKQEPARGGACYRGSTPHDHVGDKRLAGRVPIPTQYTIDVLKKKTPPRNNSTMTSGSAR